MFICVPAKLLNKFFDFFTAADLSFGNGLHQDITDSGCLYRSGIDGNTQSLGCQAVQQLITASATYDIELFYRSGNQAVQLVYSLLIAQGE